MAGDFTSVNGASRNYLARLNSDGSLDSTFLNGMSGADTALFCLALQTDGKIVIGGWFNSFNGIGHMHLARLNSDGSVDTSFLNGVAGPLGRVWSIAVQTNSQIVIGGDFTSVNGVLRNHLARLNSNGNLDFSFLNSGVGVSDDVWSIALQPDGKILVGGEFTSLLGTDHNCLARLNPDGTLDGSFLNGQYGPNDVVRSLSLQSDGKLLLGGQFTEVNDVPLNFVARLLTAPGAARMSNLRLINGQFSFDMIGEAGKTLIVQGSTNLQQWVSLATNVLQATPSTFSDSQSLTLRQRYYRLMQ
jgi:uncharacterized delta-60 repeat protein